MKPDSRYLVTAEPVSSEAWHELGRLFPASYCISTPDGCLDYYAEPFNWLFSASPSEPIENSDGTPHSYWTELWIPIMSTNDRHEFKEKVAAQLDGTWKTSEDLA